MVICAPNLQFIKKTYKTVFFIMSAVFCVDCCANSSTCFTVKETKSEDLASPVQEVLTKEMSTIFGETRDPNELNNHVLNNNNSLAHQLAGKKSL